MRKDALKVFPRSFYSCLTKCFFYVEKEKNTPQLVVRAKSLSVFPPACRNFDFVHSKLALGPFCLSPRSFCFPEERNNNENCNENEDGSLKMAVSPQFIRELHSQNEYFQRARGEIKSHAGTNRTAGAITLLDCDETNRATKCMQIKACCACVG